MDRDRYDQLTRSWDANADAWARVVRDGAIESRRVATDDAIIAAVTALQPRRVLDVGCGEGWLARALEARGISVVGVDGSAALIASAKAAGAGEYHHLTYEQLVEDPQRLGRNPFDAVICNFALLHEPIDSLLRALREMLEPEGVLLIQTLHPWSARGEEGYVDGWRTESFSGFGNEFTAAMPWYFRTLSSWLDALRAAGYGVVGITEPIHPKTREPLSLLISATPS